MSQLRKQKPLISIVIPCYNAERYIEECLESALNQTYDRIEVIVIDDGSTDQCAEIVGRAATRDRRINMLRTPNRGACAARNVGVNNASGQFVKFLDADDYLHPACIERHFEAGCVAHSEIAFGFSERVDANGTPAGESGPSLTCGEPVSLRWILESGPRMSDPLYPRELILSNGMFREELSRGQEYDFNVRMALNGRTFRYDGVRTSYQRFHSDPSRISHRFPERLDDWLLPIKELIESVEQRSGSEHTAVIRIKHAKWLWALGRRFLRIGRREAAIECFDAAKEMFPSNHISGGRLYREFVRVFGPRVAESCNIWTRCRH